MEKHSRSRSSSGGSSSSSRLARTLVLEAVKSHQ
jgi:hypothetical protein